MDNKIIPSELESSGLVQLPVNFSVKQELDKTTPRNVITQPFNRLSLVMNGHFFTDGIIVSPEYKTHSFGFQFDVLQDATAIDSIFEETISKLLNNEGITDWAFRTPFKQENQLWFKLKHDENKTAYRTTSNVKIFPKKPTEAPFRPFVNAQISANVSAYFSTKDKIYGYSFNVTDITVS